MKERCRIQERDGFAKETAESSSGILSANSALGPKATAPAGERIFRFKEMSVGYLPTSIKCPRAKPASEDSRPEIVTEIS